LCWWGNSPVNVPEAELSAFWLSEKSKVVVTSPPASSYVQDTVVSVTKL